VVNDLLACGAELRARNSHFLLFGQRFNGNARARGRDIEHLATRRRDDANVRAIAPYLIEVDPQLLPRGMVEFVPSVEQQ
jgi:hypothetical protein